MSHGQLPQALAVTTAGATGLSTDDEPVEAQRVDVFGEAGVYVWQKAMHVACDLPEPVRYSLAVLALYMDSDGSSGRPGVARFMLARRMADKTVRRHLAAAAKAGWLVCDARGGKDWNGAKRASTYSGAVPMSVFKDLETLLTPAWGKGPWTQEVTNGRPVESPSSGQHERPVGQSSGQHERPVEAATQPVISTPQPVISAASTGHPGRPTTDPSHRSLPPLSAPAAPRPDATPDEQEREETRASRTDDGERIVRAYVDGRREISLPTGQKVAAQVRVDAEELLAEGYPVQWLCERAREIARRAGWTDLRKHCERSATPAGPPAVRPSLAAEPRPARPCCIECDAPFRSEPPADRLCRDCRADLDATLTALEA